MNRYVNKRFCRSRHVEFVQYPGRSGTVKIESNVCRANYIVSVKKCFLSFFLSFFVYEKFVLLVCLARRLQFLFRFQAIISICHSCRGNCASFRNIAFSSKITIVNGTRGIISTFSTFLNNRTNIRNFPIEICTSDEKNFSIFFLFSLSLAVQNTFCKVFTASCNEER